MPLQLRARANSSRLIWMLCLLLLLQTSPLEHYVGKIVPEPPGFFELTPPALVRSCDSTCSLPVLHVR